MMTLSQIDGLKAVEAIKYELDLAIKSINKHRDLVKNEIVTNLDILMLSDDIKHYAVRRVSEVENISKGALEELVSDSAKWMLGRLEELNILKL